MIVDVYIENSKIDLFNDEPIEVNSSIANVDDITKNTTDYSKTFTVPASKNNNRIFKHYYDATIDNTFDARIKINGRIELGGIPFKYGKWKLQKVNVKQNKPYSYTINFTGNLVSLKDKFKSDELKDLDLSAFDHEYNSDNIKDGLTTSLFSGNIIYNLFSKKQLYYRNDASDNVNTETLANIAFGGGANVGVNWFDLKPSIKLSALIEVIQTKYNIVFSDDFFSRTEIADIYLWLNSETSSSGTENEQLIEYDSGDIDDYGYNFTTFTWDGTQPITTVGRFFYRIFITPSDLSIPYKIVVKNFGVPVIEYQATGYFETSEVVVPTINGADTPFSYTFHFVSSASISYEAGLLIDKVGIFPQKTGANTTQSITANFVTSLNTPKIKVIDFIKGLFSMFKLVVIADQNDNIYVNTLNDYYAQGQLYDITKYIDFSSYDVERGNILNTIKFNFSEPTTLLNTQFKLNTGIAYGDEETVLEDENGQLLDGDEFVIELPFEQFVYERLIDLDDNTNTNVMYAGIFDAEIKPVNPKPHLFYNNNQNLGTKTVAFIDDTNAKVEITTLNVPSHTYGFDNPEFALIFGAEFNEWNGQIIDKNLYTNYYQEYIDSIFNIKRRTFKFNAKQIPLRILTKLKLNDVLKIRNNYYRIDNNNLNLLSRETSFTLINSFNNNINSITGSRLQIIADYKSQTQSVYINNMSNKAFSFSASWLNVTSVGDNVFFELDENTTTDPRAVTVTVYDSVTPTRKIDVYVLQNEEI